VVELFRELHMHKDDAQTRWRGRWIARAAGARWTRVDVVRSGRYVTWRCASRHGRFATFASFMIEKGFVRQLTQPEIADLAARVRVIHCACCGAPIDLRQHDACPYCHAALSLLDPRPCSRPWPTTTAARAPPPRARARPTWPMR
jgi:hypothetical protein